MMRPYLLYWLSLHFTIVCAGPRIQDLLGVAPVTSVPYQLASPNSTARVELGKRDDNTITSTCGYSTGDANQPRTANPGFDCTIDSANGIWGFCPTTVVDAGDCGLADNCVDLAGCKNGCGVFSKTGLTTFSWYAVPQLYSKLG